jgi:hypothetical protein
VHHVLEVGGGSVTDVDTALVVSEDHVHHPVEAMLNRPVAADSDSSWFASNSKEVM